ncbi:hypothetical protein TraAM80_01687 [Trypanosoma rangeli]|uniref:Uncharacterized protein n=1 Tax=Trypanosoma rangeli TaxID=5698 RepID=A0A3R7KMD4_TRYRA|nr:uncharacterized protein TraAM80_01687 [Trypanosoma rangeli]RNF10328.1 hypothetical protein TraAM80_01687 [Trypanosoma rangeli]|eukprot:RNF10328.1 hypothetical protein TraAM80_01687 [Trypanosoma rangeli]
MQMVDAAARRKTVFSAGSGTGEIEATKDVFVDLYKDAATRRQRRKETGRPCPSDAVSVAPFSFEESLRSQERNRTPRQADVVRPGSAEGVTQPGFTKFQTNRRIDSLALPRGPYKMLVHPPSPNYGRVLSFTEEEAQSKRDQDLLRPRPLLRPPRLTIPLSNPALNRLATPRATSRVTPMSQCRSGSREEGHPIIFMNQGSRRFRF